MNSLLPPHSIQVAPAGHNGDGQPKARRPRKPATILAGADVLERTDLAMARRFVTLNGGDVRYCPAHGWLIWNGTNLGHDTTGAVVERAKATVREIVNEGLANPLIDRQQELLKLATWAASESRIKAMLGLVKSEPEIAVSADRLDADPWVLNLVNGTLDLKTGELKPHNRDDLITKVAPVEYRPEASHPTWSRFLDDTTGGDADFAAFLQRAVGYSLSGSTAEEKLFFAHGPAATGKSTFIEAIKATLGNYAMTADFETFLERKGASGPRNDVARLAGARFVASVEVSDGRKMAQGLVTMLTGGDTVSARMLYKEHFDFCPRFKLWLGANHAPYVDSDDTAMWRRIIMLPFDHVVPVEKRDPSIKDTLKNDPEARSAILAWAVAGCTAWQTLGLAVPDVVNGATGSLRDEMDSSKDFFTEQCVFGPGYWAESRRLRSTYVEYAESMGIRYPLSVRQFNERLKVSGCRPEKKHEQRGWAGVGLVQP